MANIGGGLQGALSGVGGFLGGEQNAAGLKAEAEGDFQAATYYADAADISRSNEDIVKSSTAIQEAQLGRKIFQAEGTETAQVAGGNLEGGSAGDLLRQSMQQGALAKGVLQQQGQIEVQSYEQQAVGLQAQEASAIGAGNAALHASEAAATGGVMSLLSGGLSLATMFL